MAGIELCHRFLPLGLSGRQTDRGAPPPEKSCLRRTDHLQYIEGMSSKVAA